MLNTWVDLGSYILNYNNDNTKAGLFNGNIAYMLTDIREFGSTNPNDRINAMAYQYDQLHRIKQARSAKWDGTGYDFNGKYDTDYAFDGNGNITNLKRKFNGVLIDDIHYIYNEINGKLQDNKLNTIQDYATNGNTFGDIVNVHTGVNTSGSAYSYDELGNLVAESDLYYNPSLGQVQQGYNNIDWTLTGKTKRVFYASNDPTNREEVNFTYDVGDYRLSKQTTSVQGGTTKYFYMRDGGGNPMAVYRQVEEWVEGVYYENTYLVENSIYGSNRLGIVDYQTGRLVASKALADIEPPYPPLPTYAMEGCQKERGNRRYELANHLGNVLVVVSDFVNGVDIDNDEIADNYEAIVKSASDYYPYGWTMPERQVVSSYRYGYNGQETDKEWRGGQAISFRFRVSDPRLGRFLSVDPLAPEYPWYTPYQFAGNKVIWAKELEGLEEDFATDDSEMIGIWIAAITVESVHETRQGLQNLAHRINNTLFRNRKHKANNIRIQNNKLGRPFGNLWLVSDKFVNKTFKQKFYYGEGYKVVPKGKKWQEYLEGTFDVLSIFSLIEPFNPKTLGDNSILFTKILPGTVSGIKGFQFAINTAIQAKSQGTMKGMGLALGLQKRNGEQYSLDIFAARVGALHKLKTSTVQLYRQTILQGTSFVDGFQTAMKQTDKVFFELDGIWNATKRSNTLSKLNKLPEMPKDGYYTVWELDQIIKNPNYFKKTTFFYEGKEYSKDKLKTFLNIFTSNKYN